MTSVSVYEFRRTAIPSLCNQTYLRHVAFRLVALNAEYSIFVRFNGQREFFHRSPEEASTRSAETLHSGAPYAKLSDPAFLFRKNSSTDEKARRRLHKALESRRVTERAG